MAMDPSQITNLPGISDVLAKGADKLMEAVSTYGPQATELALAVGRVAALKELAIAAACVAAGGAILKFVTLRCWHAFKTERDEPTGTAYHSLGYRGMNEAVVAPAAIGGVMSLIFGAALILVQGPALLNPFVWVGLWHPEIYLAAKFMGL